MVKTKKYTTLYESKEIISFIEKEKMNDIQRAVYISRIGIYLNWRDLTLTEFLDSLKTNHKAEEKRLNQYAEFCLENKKTNYASNIRRFIRYLGYKIDSPLSAIRKREKKVFFDNDPAMKRFLDLYRNNDYSESHTRRANRSLNEFCLWRGKKPSQLVEEELTSQEFTNLLLDFKTIRIHSSKKYSWKAIKNSSWSLKLQAIQYFYLRIHSPPVQDLLLTKEKKVRNNGEIRGMKKDKRTIITKEDIRKLIDSCSNYRQKAILSSLFESGISIGDLLEIRYSQIKGKVNIDSFEDNPKAISFYHVRSKTNVGFFGCFGENAIHYITLHLNERKQLYKKDVEDNEFIFADNNQPNSKPNSNAIRKIMYTKAERLGIKRIKPHDFRRTFNTLATRTGKLLEHQIRSMMGHLNVSMGQVYDVSKEKEVLEDYLKIYDVCFNFKYDDLKYKSLEEENQEIKKALKEVSNALENLFSAFTNPEGISNLTREDLERAMRKLREIG